MTEPGTRQPEPAPQGSSVAGKLISVKEIRQLFSLGRTAAYDLTHRPDFPAPVRISPRCYRWWESEVTAFAADLRDQNEPSRSRLRGRAAAVPDAPALRISGKVRIARSRRKSQ